jgi:hypothetical protein
MRKLIPAGLALLAIVAATAAHATSLKILRNFCVQTKCTDGKQPDSVVLDASGIVFGSTVLGGAHGGGTIFQIVPNFSGTSKYTVLYSMCSVKDCRDGYSPVPGLVVDTKDDIFGVTAGGYTGVSIFELSPDAAHKHWTYKILVTELSYVPLWGLSYAGQNSGAPWNGTQPLYLSTVNAVQQLVNTNNTWSLKNIYTFCQLPNCADGTGSVGELGIDGAGNIYGASGGGGSANGGAIFELSPNGSGWKETVLYSFCTQTGCYDGSDLETGVTIDAAGSLYGTTHWGGRYSEGEIYKVLMSPKPVLTILYSFCTISQCIDGKNPGTSNLVISTSGTIYGSTPVGGGYDVDPQKQGGGVLFGLNGLTEKQYHRYCAKSNCTDGENPQGQTIFGPMGTVIGATAAGGAHGSGTVFMLSP